MFTKVAVVAFSAALLLGAPPSFAGRMANGAQINGAQINGRMFNGRMMNGVGKGDAALQVHIVAVELPASR